MTCVRQQHLTPLLTDLLKLPQTSPEVAYSGNSFTFCKLLTYKKMLGSKSNEAAFNDALIQSSLQLELQVRALSLLLLHSLHQE